MGREGRVDGGDELGLQSQRVELRRAGRPEMSPVGVRLRAPGWGTLCHPGLRAGGSSVSLSYLRALGLTMGTWGPPVQCVWVPHLPQQSARGRGAYNRNSFCPSSEVRRKSAVRSLLALPAPGGGRILQPLPACSHGLPLPSGASPPHDSYEDTCLRRRATLCLSEPTLSSSWVWCYIPSAFREAQAQCLLPYPSPPLAQGGDSCSRSHWAMSAEGSGHKPHLPPGLSTSPDSLPGALCSGPVHVAEATGEGPSSSPSASVGPRCPVAHGSVSAVSARADPSSCLLFVCL